MAFVGVLAVGIGVLIVGKKLKPAILRLVQDRKFAVVLALFLIIYVGMFAVSFVISPQFLDRYILFTTVPLFIFMARAVELVVQQRLWAWIGVGVIALGLLVKLDLNPSNLREPKAVADGIRTYKTVSTPLVICPPYRDLAFLYHYDRAAFADYSHKAEYLADHAIYPINSLSELPPDLMAVNDTILFLDADSEFSHPGNGIGDALGAAFLKEDQVRYDTVSLLRIFTR